MWCNFKNYNLIGKLARFGPTQNDSEVAHDSIKCLNGQKRCEGKLTAIKLLINYTQQKDGEREREKKEKKEKMCNLQ